jgi:hypothetical protein
MVAVQKQRRISALIVGGLLFRVLNSMYWALVGGLGWGFGTAVGESIPVADAATFGGAVGLAVTLFSLLAVRWGEERTEYTPMHLAWMGGAAAGSATLALLVRLRPEVYAVLGGGLGFFLALPTPVMKQYFAPVTVLRAGIITLAGSALFSAIGFLAGGVLGWTAASAVSLVTVVLLAECLRRERVVELDEKGQPIRTVARGEMVRRTFRQSCSLSDPLAWGWNGLFGGLAASAWAFWVAAQPDLYAVRVSFLVFGGMAIIAVIGVRFGILKPAKRSQPADGQP